MHLIQYTAPCGDHASSLAKMAKKLKYSWEEYCLDHCLQTTTRLPSSRRHPRLPILRPGQKQIVEGSARGSISPYSRRSLASKVGALEQSWQARSRHQLELPLTESARLLCSTRRKTNLEWLPATCKRRVGSYNSSQRLSPYLGVSSPLRVTPVAWAFLKRGSNVSMATSSNDRLNSPQDAKNLWVLILYEKSGIRGQ